MCERLLFLKCLYERYAIISSSNLGNIFDWENQIDLLEFREIQKLRYIILTFYVNNTRNGELKYNMNGYTSKCINFIKIL